MVHQVRFRGEVKRLTEGPAAVYNSIGKTTVEQSLTRVKVRGTLVLYGSASGDVPPLDLTKLASLGSLYAKYKAVKHETMTEAESNVWERIQSLIYRFQKADRIVLKTPMWNFGLPSKLKQLIDLVTQRNYMLAYDGKQYSPLLNVEKAIVAYTRGSRFLEGTFIPPSRFDHQATYLDFWLRLVGVRDLRSVIVDNARNRDRQESEVSLAEGNAALEQLVEWFLNKWQIQGCTRICAAIPVRLSSSE